MSVADLEFLEGDISNYGVHSLGVPRPLLVGSVVLCICRKGGIHGYIGYPHCMLHTVPHIGVGVAHSHSCQFLFTAAQQEPNHRQNHKQGQDSVHQRDSSRL